jgi:hypothetical protein
MYAYEDGAKGLVGTGTVERLWSIPSDLKDTSPEEMSCDWSKLPKFLYFNLLHPYVGLRMRVMALSNKGKEKETRGK